MCFDYILDCNYWLNHNHPCVADVFKSWVAGDPYGGCRRRPAGAVVRAGSHTHPCLVSHCKHHGRNTCNLFCHSNPTFSRSFNSSLVVPVRTIPGSWPARRPRSRPSSNWPSWMPGQRQTCGGLMQIDVMKIHLFSMFPTLFLFLWLPFSLK